MSDYRGPSERRVVVIGLDGTPFSFLKKEMEGGTLPHLSELARRGLFARMRTEIPAISSVAWSSFMTGTNPGSHGIFGFTDRRPGTWDLYFPNYSDLKKEPLWDRISRQGGRCCVLNVPSTYPAKPVNGVLVSGFVAPQLERACYPAEVHAYLSSSGYRIDVDAAKARDSLDSLLEDLHHTLDKRREAMFHFWEQEKWDFFMCVFTGTDRLHHFLWSQYEEEDPVYRPEFLNYYSRLDEIIGEFVSMLPDDICLFMLSDHGFCGIEKEVYLNAVLASAGYLGFRSEQPLTITDIDPNQTRAYCMDPGRIYLNLKGREPGGTVSRDEAEDLMQDLVGLFMDLKDPESGKPVMEQVKKGEDLFSGEQADKGPELVAVSRRGCDLKGRMSMEVFSERGLFSGMHTHDDAFAFVNKDSCAAIPGHIRDLAPQIFGAGGWR